MEYKNIYLYIPREKILNYSSRKHQKNRFSKLYYYIKKKEFIYNQQNVNILDIFDIKEIQKNTFYKDCFNSKKNEIFDVFYKLKPKFNELNEIYIEKKTNLSKNEVFFENNSNKTMKILNNYSIKNTNLIKSYNDNINIQRNKNNKKDYNIGLKNKRNKSGNPFIVYFD
jgi:hypothetical protein